MITTHGILRVFEMGRSMKMERRNLDGYIAAQIAEKIQDDARAMSIAKKMIERGYPSPNRREDYLRWLEGELNV